MARYDFLVDTTPMGHSLSTLAEGVRTTSVTVLSSAEAIALAEAEAAKKISYHVSEGFFNLVVSQLNQKMARLRSSLQAKDAQLLAERKTADLLRLQFLRDFQMIKRRYHKLFNTLNKSLKLRVYELDKPLTSVLVGGFQANIKQRNQNLAIPALLTTEGQSAGQGMEIGRTKQQALRLIEAIRAYLMKTFEVQAHINAMLTDDLADDRIDILLPSLMFEFDSQAVGIRGTQFQFAGAPGESQGLYHDVVQAVSGVEIAEEAWEPVEVTERDRVVAEFQKLLDASSLSVREKAEASRLMASQESWFEVRGVQA